MNRIETLSKLCGLVGKIVLEETKGDQKLTEKVLDRSRKDSGGPITRTRERILHRLRSEISERDMGTPQWEISKSSITGIGRSNRWKKLGYKQIASVMGGDHSAWVKMSHAGIACQAIVFDG